MRKVIAAATVFALVALALAGVAWAGHAAYDESGESDTTVTNETVTADIDNWTAVDAPDYVLSFDDSVTAYNSSGAELTEGTDYEWNATDGTIKYLGGSSSVSDGEDTSVTYTYTAKTETSRQMKGILTLAYRGLPYLLFLAVGFFAIAVVAVVGQLLGARTGRVGR